MLLSAPVNPPRRLVATSAICLALVLVPAASADALEPGERAPPLDLEAIFGAPDDVDLSWDALRGNVVILEFWGIKCGPCIAAIPHLNEMVVELADEPLRVISITEDAQDDVIQFLARQPIAGWVGLDTDRSTFAAYGLRGIPTTVVVGPDGQIIAITHPTALQIDEVRAVCHGEDVDQAALKTGIPLLAGLDRGETGPVVERMEIRPASELAELAGSAGVKGRDRVTYLGYSALDLVAAVHGVRPARILGAEHLPAGRWDLIAANPGADEELFRAELRAVLEDTFQVTTSTVVETTHVYVLGAGSRGGSRLSPREEGTGASLYFGPHRIKLRNTDTKQLANCLESLTGRAVFDETGLDGVFDAELVRNESFPLDLFRQVRWMLGLSVRRERRDIEFVAIEPVDAPSPRETAHDESHLAQVERSPAVGVFFEPSGEFPWRSPSWQGFSAWPLLTVFLGGQIRDQNDRQAFLGGYLSLGLGFEEKIEVIGPCPALSECDPGIIGALFFAGFGAEQMLLAPTPRGPRLGVVFREGICFKGAPGYAYPSLDLEALFALRDDRGGMVGIGFRYQPILVEPMYLAEVAGAAAPQLCIRIGGLFPADAPVRPVTARRFPR